MSNEKSAQSESSFNNNYSLVLSFTPTMKMLYLSILTPKPVTLLWADFSLDILACRYLPRNGTRWNVTSLWRRLLIESPLSIKKNVLCLQALGGQCNFILYSQFLGSFFHPSLSVLKELDTSVQITFGAVMRKKEKLPLVSWKKICCPKKSGGLYIQGSNK